MCVECWCETKDSLAITTMTVCDTTLSGRCQVPGVTGSGPDDDVRAAEKKRRPSRSSARLPREPRQPSKAFFPIPTLVNDNEVLSDMKQRCCFVTASVPPGSPCAGRCRRLGARRRWSGSGTEREIAARAQNSCCNKTRVGRLSLHHVKRGVMPWTRVSDGRERCCRVGSWRLLQTQPQRREELIVAAGGSSRQRRRSRGHQNADLQRLAPRRQDKDERCGGALAGAEGEKRWRSVGDGKEVARQRSSHAEDIQTGNKQPSRRARKRERR